MKYKDAIRQNMEMLAEDEHVRFLGYNVKFGNKANNTLVNINENQLIETPLAENLMMGLAIGLSLAGYKPIVYFERFDFILNGLDAIVNQLDKWKDLSNYEFRPKVIIRVTVGQKLKPFFNGATHIQDFTEAMKKLVTFPIFNVMSESDIINAYKFAEQCEESVMIVEYRDYYEIEF